MGTLADIKTRVITETQRDDLADDLAAQLLLHIQSACEFYSDQKFWFNSIIATVNTTPGNAFATVPAGVRRIDLLTIPSLNAEIKEFQLGEINALDGNLTGHPSRYAYYNDQLKLWTVPDAAYALEITGLAQIPAPVADADTSVWTNQALDLIVSRTKFTLYRDQFRDAEGVQMAAGATTEALSRLKRETTRRLRTPLRASRPSQRFNINHG